VVSKHPLVRLLGTVIFLKPDADGGSVLDLN
jgi:hypothetical protein